MDKHQKNKFKSIKKANGQTSIMKWTNIIRTNGQKLKEQVDKPINGQSKIYKWTNGESSG